LGKSGTEIRNASAKAYSDKHSCSYKTGQNYLKPGGSLCVKLFITFSKKLSFLSNFAMQLWPKEEK